MATLIELKLKGGDVVVINVDQVLRIQTNVNGQTSLAAFADGKAFDCKGTAGEVLETIKGKTT